jgi:hypothetical protein
VECVNLGIVLSVEGADPFMPFETGGVASRCSSASSLSAIEPEMSDSPEISNDCGGIWGGRYRS